MGLNAGFTLRSHNAEKEVTNKVEIAYFSKFHELDSWIRYNCMQKAEDENLYDVTLEDLKILKEDLLPIARVLINVPERMMSKYDDRGSYPKKYKLDDEELICEDFNPLTSRSSFAGTKVMKLYNLVCTLINLLEDDCLDEFSIEYWHSF